MVKLSETADFVYNFVYKPEQRRWHIGPTFPLNFLCNFHTRCPSTFSIPWCKKVENDQRGSCLKMTARLLLEEARKRFLRTQGSVLIFLVERVCEKAYHSCKRRLLKLDRQTVQYTRRQPTFRTMNHRSFRTHQF